MAQPAQQLPMQTAIFAPDVYAQQAQLARQQRMAELLQQQGLEAPQGQMVSGHYVAPAMTQHLSRLAAALGGAYVNQENDEKQAALARQYGQAMAGQVDNMLGGAQPSYQDAAQAVAKLGDQTGNSGPPDPALVGAVQQAPQNPAVERLKSAAKAALMMGNQDLANKLIGNVLEMTNEQKNWNAMGLNPQQLGQLEVAKRRKEGIIELQPGTTALDLATGQERFQPKVGEGIAMNNGQASPIPGYAQANAVIAGKQAEATEGAKAGLDMVTVNTPQGPRMMTRSQAVQLSQGQSIVPQQWVGPEPKGQFVGDPQEIAASINAIKDPQIRAEAIRAFNNQMAERQEGSAGIPLESEHDKQRQQTSMAVQADSLKALTKDADQMRGMVPIFDQIERLIKAGSLGNKIGDRAEMLGHEVGLRQTDKTINTANLKKLGEQLVLSRGSLGAGVSVADAERYDKAAGDFSRAQSNEEKLKYLGIMRSVIQESYQRANDAIRSFEKSGKLNEYSLPPSENKIDDLLKKYGG